jgi:hypothetical protein
METGRLARRGVDGQSDRSLGTLSLIVNFIDKNSFVDKACQPLMPAATPPEPSLFYLYKTIS